MSKQLSLAWCWQFDVTTYTILSTKECTPASQLCSVLLRAASCTKWVLKKCCPSIIYTLHMQLILNTALLNTIGISKNILCNIYTIGLSWSSKKATFLFELTICTKFFLSLHNWGLIILPFVLTYHLLFYFKFTIAILLSKTGNTLGNVSCYSHHCILRA